MTMADGIAIIQLRGEPGHTYILQVRNTLDAGEWLNITTNRAGDNGSATLTDPGAKDFPIRFYRVAAP